MLITRKQVDRHLGDCNHYAGTQPYSLALQRGAVRSPEYTECLESDTASDASEVSERVHASCHLMHFEIRKDGATNEIANLGGDASVLPHLIASWFKACSRSSTSLTLTAMWGRLSAVGFIDATPITAR